MGSMRLVFYTSKTDIPLCMFKIYSVTNNNVQNSVLLVKAPLRALPEMRGII